MQSKTETCKWCGRPYVVDQNPIYKKGGFGWDYKGRKGYCSERCKMQSENGGKSTDSPKASELNSEAQAEIARINWEKEQVAKQEEKERQEERKRKVENLKNQNRPIAAYFVKNEFSFLLFLIPAILLFVAWGADLIIGILSTIIFVAAGGFLAYKYFTEYKSRVK